MSASEFAVLQSFRTDRRSPARWVWSHVSRHPGLILMTVVGAFGNAALAAAVPLLVGQAFNAVLASPPDVQRVGLAALWIVVSQLVRSVLQLGRNFGSALLGQRLERDARDELYASLLGKSMAFHSLKPKGEIMARASNDVHELSLMFEPGINLILGSGNFLVMPLLLAPAYHPALLLVPSAFVVAYVVAVRGYLRELRPVTERARRSFGAMNAALAEAVEGIETVKGAAQETKEIERFERHAREFRDASVHQGDIESRFLPALLLGVTLAAGLLHALILFRAGLLNTGQVIGYVGLLQLFGFPTFISMFAFSQMASGLASARRILELIETETELDQNRTGYAGVMRGEICFERVSFNHVHGAPGLDGLNFHIRPGQTVAIVGQTGSGKTSLIKLINRIFDVTEGRVLIDGVDVREWNLESLRGQISVIEQDLFLFSRTVSENIAFGRPDATPAEIETAAGDAQAHDFIARFADGYATTVGERGVTLSGGQRQRLALARAFLTDPKILILDDSTSAIDSATEDLIQRAIRRAARGRTTLLITHRLSQIRWADLILVLRKGQIAAMGTHEELMEASEPYRRIFARYQSTRPVPVTHEQ